VYIRFVVIGLLVFVWSFGVGKGYEAFGSSFDGHFEKVKSMLSDKGGAAGCRKSEHKNDTGNRMNPKNNYRKNVAVSNFKQKVGMSGPDADLIGEEWADLLAHALIESDKFVVVGLQAVESTLHEEKKLIFVKGEIVEFPQKPIKNPSSWYLEIFSSDQYAEKHEVAISLRIEDLKNGNVFYLEKVENEMEVENPYLRGQEGGVYSGGKDTINPLLVQSIYCVVRSAAWKIFNILEAVPFEGIITEVSENGRKVLTNAGYRNNLAKGDEFNVFRPDESLQTDRTRIGSLKIVEVYGESSRALYTPIQDGIGNKVEIGFILRQKS